VILTANNLSRTREMIAGQQRQVALIIEGPFRDARTTQVLTEEE
jgi:hypothetical protein